jgi:hypothetical protein
VIVENDAIDVELPGDLDSIFGDFDFDFDRYLAEQEARPTVDDNDSRVTNQNTGTPADQTDSWVSGNEFEKSDNPSTSTRRLKEQRGHAKRRRQSQHNLLDAMCISDELQVIRRSSSTAVAIVESRRATSRVCLRIAVQNGPNQGLGVAVQV